MLRLSRWDPAIFDLASDRISDLVNGADVDVVQYFSRNLPKVVDNFYFVPGVNDVLFDVGVFYQRNSELEKGFSYFLLSLEYNDDGYEVLFNLGYCLLS